MPGRATTPIIVGLAAALCLPSCGRDGGAGPPPSSPSPPTSPTPPSPTPTPTGEPAAAEDEMIIRPDRPVRWSRAIDAEALRSLKSGRRRLGISVTAYE